MKPMPLQLRDKTPDGEAPRVLYLTWNLANGTPTQDDIDKILGEHEATGAVDAIVIATQEETRAQKKSLGHKLGHKLDANKTENGVYIAFDTRTKITEPGRVALTLISKQLIEAKPIKTVQESTGKGWKGWLQKKFGVKNKGGVALRVTLGKEDNAHTFDVASMHLDSYDNTIRSRESNQMMANIDGDTKPIKPETPEQSVEKAVNRYSRPLLLGGDLNYRKEVDDKAAESFQAGAIRTAEYATHGLTAAPFTQDSFQYTYSGRSDKELKKAAEELKEAPKKLDKEDAAALARAEQEVFEFYQKSATQPQASTDEQRYKIAEVVAANKADGSRPAERRGGRLDQLLTRGAGECEARVHKHKGKSDHYPVSAVVTLPKQVKTPEEKFEVVKKGLLVDIEMLTEKLKNLNKITDSLDTLKESISKLTYQEDNSKAQLKDLGQAYQHVEKIRQAVLAHEKVRIAIWQHTKAHQAKNKSENTANLEKAALKAVEEKATELENKAKNPPWHWFFRKKAKIKAAQVEAEKLRQSINIEGTDGQLTTALLAQPPTITQPEIPMQKVTESFNVKEEDQFSPTSHDSAGSQPSTVAEKVKSGSTLNASMGNESEGDQKGPPTLAAETPQGSFASSDIEVASASGKSLPSSAPEENATPLKKAASLFRQGNEQPSAQSYGTFPSEKPCQQASVRPNSPVSTTTFFSPPPGFDLPAQARRDNNPFRVY